MNTDHKLSDLMAVAAARATPVVRGIGDEQLGAPTPCAEYDVKDLVNHLLHVVVEFQALAAKGSADFTVTPDYVARDADWRERFAREADGLAAAWSAPGADEGTTGTMGLPAATVGAMALLDLTVHAWDLARATGQEYEVQAGAPGAPGLADVLEVLRGAVEGMAPTARSMGVFGEPVPVREDATSLERLLARTGRDPAWLK
ncbi:TIGR03086 family metal-binding protein [Streptomyces sp. NRRL B-1347]|uniref:TIGR03086 family metal-binding protein n=1 Tax=Streptomyces sp. NRRL B-1347 TaxID=1476877 RepID=UPI0004C6BA30|nr:TIGR03086 family metal-binding protein [Streptomyces sp. NRRL B-1347]